MKEKTRQKKNQIAGLTFSHFINASLVILTLVILFLGYRLLDRFGAFNINDESGKLNQTEKIIQIEVLNGCGVDAIADKFTEMLRKENFDVVHTGNYRSFNIDESIIIDRAGNIKNARLLAGVIGMNDNRIINQVNKDYFLDVTLIIGKDYKQLFKNL
ncbi:MAG: LytR C-terminal domain-containing protein [Ignavibacteria bacterium]